MNIALLSTKISTIKYIVAFNCCNNHELNHERDYDINITFFYVSHEIINDIDYSIIYDIIHDIKMTLAMTIDAIHYWTIIDSSTSGGSSL